MARVLLDFDGTLAHARRWSQCLVDVLDDLAPGHSRTIDDVRAHLRDGFPWHRPEEAHLHLDSPDAWWESLDPLLAGAFGACGIGPDLVPLVGDNPEADLAGAERVGMRAILVRHPDGEHDLLAAARRIVGTQNWK